MSIETDGAADHDFGYTLQVTYPTVDEVDGQPTIEYREGNKKLRGWLESHWTFSVSVKECWEPPYDKEPIPDEKREQIERNIIRALEQQGFSYYHFD